MSRWDKTIIAIWLICVIAIAGNIYSATNFPTTLDSWTDQTAADLITSAKWNKLQDAINALEVKVGADSSAVTTTIDYKLTTEIAATANLRTTLGVSPMPEWVQTIAEYAHSSGVTKADLVKLNGVTASVGELNTLDGITSTTDELNLLDAGNRTPGDLITETSNGTMGAIAAVAVGQYLKSAGTSTKPAYGKMALSDTGIKIGNFLIGATGDTVITGVGFNPSLVILMAHDYSTADGAFSIGFDDATTHSCMAQIYNDMMDYFTSASIYVNPTSGVYKSAYISAKGSDGFTISTTQTSTAFNARIVYVALP